METLEGKNKHMTAKKFNFTIAEIERLPAATGRTPDQYYDQKIDGLWLRVTKTGTKTFIIKRWVGNGAVTVTLGRFNATAVSSADFERDPLCVLGKNPQLNVEQARRLARAVIGELVSGRNPNDERLRLKAEMTLADLFAVYLERHAKKTRKTWATMEKDFARNAVLLKDCKISKISHAQAEKLHTELGQTRGPYAANRMVQLLKAVFNKGKMWKLYSGDNPFKGITLFPEKPRERFLSQDEVAHLIGVLQEESDQSSLRDFIILSLFTGIRKANLMSLRWDYIDWETGILTIPDTKNGTSQTMILGGREIAVLHDRQNRVKGDYIFPGTGRTGHLMDLKRSWTTLRKRANLEDCTIHDLRRSLGAGMASLNINIALVKGQLNHKDIKTTMAVYARTTKDAERQARETVHTEWLKDVDLIEWQDNLQLLKTAN